MSYLHIERAIKKERKWAKAYGNVFKYSFNFSIHLNYFKIKN